MILCVCERVRGQGVCGERKSSHECWVCVREESQMMYPDAYVREKQTHTTRIFTCVRTNTHIYIHTHTHALTHTHTHTHTRMFVRLRVYVDTFTSISRAFTHKRTPTHTCTDKDTHRHLLHVLVLRALSR